MLFKPRQKPSLTNRAQNLIWPRSGLRRAVTYLWHRLVRIRATPHVIALGFAAGAFASFTPFVGMHFIIAGIIALMIGGNVLASALGTCVGNPLTFPFIWLSTFNLGGFILGYDQRDEIDLALPDGMWLLLFKSPSEFWAIFWGAIGPVLTPMMLGCIPIGLISSVIVYFLLYPVVEGFQHRRKARLERRKLPRTSAANPS